MASFFRALPRFCNGNDKENVPLPTAPPVAKNPAVSTREDSSKTVDAADKDTDKFDDDGSVSSTDEMIKDALAASAAKRSSQPSTFSSSDEYFSDDDFVDEDVSLANLGDVTMTPTDAACISRPQTKYPLTKRSKMVLPTAKAKKSRKVIPKENQKRAASKPKKSAVPAPKTPSPPPTTTAPTPKLPPTTPTPTTNAAALVSPPTTGRSAIAKATAKKKKEKSSRQPPVKKGSRIKTRRSQIFHMLEPHQQACLPREHPNYHNYYGDVIRKSVGPKPSYDIRLDIFRGNDDETVARGIRRSCFTTVKRGEDEVALDRKYANKEMEAEANDELEKTDKGEINSEKAFVKLSSAEIKEAKTFTHEFLNKKKQPIQWRILPDAEDITGCEFTPLLRESIDEGPTLKEDVAWALQHLPMDEFFLKYVWPDMDGMAARLDQYYQDARAKYYKTVAGRRITFHDANNKDPDWKLKQFVLLTIKGASVHGKGIGEFWLAGKLSEGSVLEGADFGKYMDVNTYRAIADALPFMWGDESLWYKDRRDVPWQIFTPFIEAWNNKQKALMSGYNMLIMDETFIAWCPKTTKLGGLPNYSYEPRKPKGLGTMLKDIAEAVIGVLLYTDPSMAPSVQDKKKFSNRLSQSPDAVSNAVHAPHVAEVLRQVYYTDLHKQKNPFVGGDAWFGSVAACLALKLEKVEDEDGTNKPMDINSAFVVKNNTSCFPRGPLHAVLKARYPKRMIGHWVVFTTEIKGVSLIAMAYAWSNNDIAYMISTFGNTSACKDDYISNEKNTAFDGLNDTKTCERPDVYDVLFKFLPAIDSINNTRQYGLQLETNWPTKNCWTKLLVAFMGHSVVNHQRLLAYQYPCVPGKDMTVVDMATSISCGALLKTIRRKILPRSLQTNVASLPLKRLADNNGLSSKQLTKKQRDAGRSVGTAKQNTCFICKKYHSKCSWTSGCCVKCGTVVCMKDRGRPMSCTWNIRCNGIKQTVFPVTSRAPDYK